MRLTTNEIRCAGIGAVYQMTEDRAMAETQHTKVGDVIDIYADGDYNSPSHGLVICSGEVARTQDGEYCAAIVCYIAADAKYVWAWRDDKGDWVQISREMHCEISAEFDTIIEALVHG